MARKAFTLVEIMIAVSIIVLLASVAVPNIFRSRIIVLEAAAITNMKTIVNACNYYHSSVNEFPADLATLGQSNPPYIDSDLASGQKQRYQFQYVAVSDDHFTLNVNPLSTGLLKGRYFYTDESGLIRQRGNEPAGPEDEVIK